MYIEDWDSFAQQAEALYRSDPIRTRYVMKYRHCDKKLVLKVTDDKVCLQYATDQAADLKRVEKLNNLFFALMARGADAPEPELLEETAAVTNQRPHKNRRKG
ncbi:hypothetical protein WJX72_002222 [[Myrmecia] bisecta]|uniref:Signal recognition particle 9 kDa protein n=1 Tax=[Myrmecia] bisecta TaxID=41462 RepID=A0AAW1QPK9_9CHLO